MRDVFEESIFEVKVKVKVRPVQGHAICMVMIMMTAP